VDATAPPLVGYWKCLRCPEWGHGGNREVDLAARKHLDATTHGTVTHIYEQK
jgi:hypothetical protein